jgi:hypothetical protein
VFTPLVENPPRSGALASQDALQCVRRRHAHRSTASPAIGFCCRRGLAALELARSGVDLIVRRQLSRRAVQTRAPPSQAAVRARVPRLHRAAVRSVHARAPRTRFEDEMAAANAQWQLNVYGGVQPRFTERTLAPGLRLRLSMPIDELVAGATLTCSTTSGPDERPAIA